MQLIELGASCFSRSHTAATCTSAIPAASKSKPHIDGFGPEDSWETFALARYRAYTTSGYATRLYNSEPDLLQRRPIADVVAPRQHRPCATMPKPDTKLWVRAEAKLPARQAAPQKPAER